METNFSNNGNEFSNMQKKQLRNKSTKSIFNGIRKGFIDFGRFIWYNKLFSIILIIIIMIIGSNIDPVSKREKLNSEQTINTIRETNKSLQTELDDLKGKTLDEIRDETITTLEQKLKMKEDEIVKMQYSIDDKEKDIKYWRDMSNEKDDKMSILNNRLIDIESKMKNVESISTTIQSYEDNKKANTKQESTTTITTSQEIKDDLITWEDLWNDDWEDDGFWVNTKDGFRVMKDVMIERLTKEANEINEHSRTALTNDLLETLVTSDINNNSNIIDGYIQLTEDNICSNLKMYFQYMGELENSPPTTILEFGNEYGALNGYVYVESKNYDNKSIKYWENIKDLTMSDENSMPIIKADDPALAKAEKKYKSMDADNYKNFDLAVNDGDVLIKPGLTIYFMDIDKAMWPKAVVIKDGFLSISVEDFSEGTRKMSIDEFALYYVKIK